MTQKQTKSARDDMRAWERQIGDPVFAAILALSVIFCFALFALRADKIFSFPASIADASAEDLVAFWRASQMALAGDAAAVYDRLVFQAPLTPPNDNLVWWNPPHALLLFWPLSFLHYGVAKALWIGASITALAGVVRLLQGTPLKHVVMLVSPAAFASLLVLQSGPFIALGLFTALLMADRRPLLSGLLLALLTVKPQYGLMAPVFLAAIGAWRAFGAAAVFTALLAALSAALFGIEAWRQFIAAPTSDYVTSGVYRDMISVSQTLQKLGAGEILALAAQGLTAAACAASVWWIARHAPRQCAIGFTLLASAVAAPVIWIYDWPLIAAGLLLLAQSSRPWPIGVQIIAGLSWLGPLYSLGFGTMPSSIIAPGLLLAVTILMAWLINNQSHQKRQAATG